MHFYTLASLFAISSFASAELTLPAIIGDNMVLQQQHANPLWGWDRPGTEVTVGFAGQQKTARAGADGKWSVTLDPVSASAKPVTLSFKGSSSREIQNVLVGEVWLCSGQSNMQWSVGQSWDADLEIGTAKYSQIRLISVPQVGTQEPRYDFKGLWQECSPSTVADFSAVGFFYGRILHQMLDVPIGLIDNSWGGSSAEAWVRRDLLENDPRFESIIKNWIAREKNLSSPEAQLSYENAMADWQSKADEAKAAGKTFAVRPPEGPDQTLRGQHRPGNLYNGVLLPIIGYGIKGSIWYQGESNADRAWEYAQLFPFMIQHWRTEWKQGDFPFYWVQLADFQPENPKPGNSNWAELRESQTKTQNVIQSGGQAVILDLGQANDIHPKNKRDVAARLARIALAKDYGFKIPYRSPEFKQLAIQDDKAIVSLDTFGGTLRTLDVDEVKGLAICGEDRQWVWAEAKITGPNELTIHNPDVTKPIAVRYAWADNPVCNLYTTDGLPVTPFRSDDFPMITQPKAN